MEYLTIRDQDIFREEVFPMPEQYEKRVTVKAVVENEAHEFGFVTNDTHGCLLLAGGEAESNDLEAEIARECAEELGYDVQVIRQIGRAHEFRNREAKEYDTICFFGKATEKIAEDRRTTGEKRVGLQAVWLPASEALRVLEEQVGKLERGEIAFYNTAFNVLRDHKFFSEFLKTKDPN